MFRDQKVKIRHCICNGLYYQKKMKSLFRDDNSDDTYDQSVSLLTTLTKLLMPDYVEKEIASRYVNPTDSTEGRSYMGRIHGIRRKLYRRLQS